LSRSIKAPFISLTTKSEFLCQGYLKYLKSLGIERHPKRNKRDKAYNIMLSQESAIFVAKVLYENSYLRMNRKFDKFLEMKSWTRPPNKKKRIYEESHWTKEEIIFLVSHTNEESESNLNKTALQIKNKIANLKARGLPSFLKIKEL